MSTLEKLFVQIFERKNWIIDQVKQQRDLYEQQLASKLLIKGIRPPLWLWNDGTETGTADLTELKKQDLICGLLIPPSRSKVPSTGDHCTFYSKTAAKSYNEPTSDSIFLETCASNKYFDVGARLTLVPNCHLNENEIAQKCSLNRTCELDPAIASPQDQTSVRASDNSFEPGQSEIAQKCISNRACELDPTIASPQDQTSVRASDNSFEPGQSLARIQRSRPRQKALELRNSGKAKSERPSSKVGNCSVYSGRVTRFRTACQQPNTVKELLELNKASDIADDEGGGAAQTKTEKCPSSGNDTTVHSGRLASSGISCKLSVQELVEMGNYSDIACEGPDRVPGFSPASLQMSYFGKSLQAHGALRQFEGDNNFQDARAVQVTVQKFDSGQKVKKSSDRLQTNPRMLQSNRDISNRYTARNAASSILEFNYAEGFPKANDSKNTSARRTRSRSVSCDEPSQIAKQLKLVEGHDLKESGSQVDILPCSDAKGIVNQEKWNVDIAETDPGMLSSNGDISIRYTARNAASSTLEFNYAKGFSEANDLKNTSARRTRSRSVSCDEPSQIAKQLKLVEGHDLKESGSQVDILPCSDAKGIVNQEKWNVDIAETDRVSNGPVEACSFLRLNCAAGSLQFNNSSKITSGRVTCSKSDSTDNPCQLAEPLNWVEGSNLQKASEAQVDIQPCSDDDPEIVNEENIIVGTKHVSSVPALPCSIYSQSNMHGGSHRDGLEFLLKRLPSESSMLLEPKQLVFNDVEVFNLNEGVDPMEKGIQGRPLEIRSFSSLGPAESLEKVAISDVFQQKCDTSMDELLVQKELAKEVVNREKEAQRAYSEAEAEKSTCDYYTTSIGKTSKSPAMPSRNAASKFYEDAVPDKSPEINKTPSQIPYLTDDLVTRQVGEKSPTRMADSSLPGVDVDPQADRSGKKYNSKLDIGPGKIFPEDCKLGNDATRSFLCQMAAGDSPQMGNTGTKPPYCLRSSNSHDKSVGSSKLSDSLIAKKSMISTKTKKNAVECSWPQSKRRKVEGRASDAFTASVRLRRGKQLQEINEETEYRYLEKVENGVEAISEVQHFTPCEMNIAQPNAVESPDVQMHEKESFHKVECLESPTKLHIKEDELFLEGRDHSAETTLTCNDKHVLSSLEDHGSLSYCLVSSAQTQVVDLISANQTMPEFKEPSMGEPIENDPPCIAKNGSGFDHSDLLSTSIGQDNILEQLYRSSRMLTPLPHASTKYKVHRTPEIYQSLPNGLLEHMYLRNSLLFDADESNGMSAEVDRCFLGRSYSDCMSSSSVQFSWDVKRPPCTPPVKKLCRTITAASNDSLEKQENINPELTCFRIEEDPNVCEENEDMDEMVDPVNEGIQSRGKNFSTKKEPLADVTNECLKSSISVSLADKSVERGSLDSVSAGFNTSQTQMDTKQKLQSCYGTLRKCMNKDKENKWSSVGGSGSSKATEYLQTRFSKPKLPRKVSEGKGGQSLLENGSKRNNIVSNISSFIPFVQQKQPAAAFTGKRDIKVKALEAAEAARLLEEKRENERKMKKEAVKRERAKLEQENLKQLELKQKRKEEERKKKEADLVARKRLREEEERKEKERKRKCIEEARRQQREHEERLRVEKEEKETRRRAADERERKGNERPDEARRPKKMGKSREGSDCRKKTETELTAMVSACEAREASDIHQTCQAPKKSDEMEKEICNLYKAREDVISVTEGSLEQSYAISPYQGSDDEEEEEDMPNQKFIPSWASENCLAQMLPALNKVDPDGIFPASSFCSIAEVLLLRKQQLK
ncbi:uncharacterized protein LOC122643673 [Telopea speciosissima]|uniref:uncharacterized protein LOC122643673 n=1 Tax=Telopea speciosissima TaxID=54955 RepID=UPI001CC53555|nr:uncharacterized protein LOC122643673 [Telopea speciosissima]